MRVSHFGFRRCSGHFTVSISKVWERQMRLLLIDIRRIHCQWICSLEKDGMTTRSLALSVCFVSARNHHHHNYRQRTDSLSFMHTAIHLNITTIPARMALCICRSAVARLVVSLLQCTVWVPCRRRMSRSMNGSVLVCVQHISECVPYMFAPTTNGI